MTDYREILRLKSLGNSQRQIEKALCVSHHTVTDVLAPGDFSHYGPGDFDQFQPNEKSQAIFHMRYT